MDAKTLLEASGLFLALVGGIIALVQWRRDQAWKRAEKLDTLYKEFGNDRLIQIACRVLDWSRGNFKFPDGEEFRFTDEDVQKSLVVHGCEELTFTSNQARMRDAYDAILAFFDRLETAVDGGLIDQGPTMNLFGYWIRHFGEMPEHPKCAESAFKYVDQYSNKLSFVMLFWRASGKNLSEAKSTGGA